jgi:transcriptional regulator of arginine metabolism
MAINGNQPNVKQRRQRALLDLITQSPIGSQDELVELLRERGFDVTQATVSRDAAEIGLVKVPRGDRHIYATPETAATGNAYDARLRRLLEDIPVRIGRSGLGLVLLATPGSAGAIAQAIDQSSFADQIGTLAGDNTLLVLFETEAALERWLVRFQTFQPSDASARPDARPLAHSEAPR